jgi:hypothetical protein
MSGEEERRLEILRLEREAAERADKLAMARHPNAAAAALILGLPASAFVAPPTGQLAAPDAALPVPVRYAAPEPDASRRVGPQLIATRAEVEAIRTALVAAGKPSGYKSIAREGGWSVSTVRRRLAGN